MYPETEVLIKLSAIEIQQALAIDLDEDAEQALSWLHEKIIEKIIEKLHNSSCRPLANMIRGPRRCLPACKKPCCLNGHRLQAKFAMAP